MVNEKELSLVKKLFRSIESSCDTELIGHISDIFVSISLNNGDVTIYNDAYENITSISIYSWAKPEYTIPSDIMIRTLNCAIRELEVEEFWDKDLFCQPLNISLVNDRYEVIEELYFLDNDMIVLSQPLLSGYDKNLDVFLKELLSE